MLHFTNFEAAPLVDFVQIDFNSSDNWEGQTFCEDKEVFVMDANGDSKYVIIWIALFVTSSRSKISQMGTNLWFAQILLKTAWQWRLLDREMGCVLKILICRSATGNIVFSGIQSNCEMS